MGRCPRDPWRVAVRCLFGYPTVIASPVRLADGTPFPTWAWLTCPRITEAVSRCESAGGVAEWASRATADSDLAAALRELDAAVRVVREREGGGEQASGDVGLAGQRNPLGVKCLHAHVAYALAGLDDPIGCAVLEQVGRDCDDERCAKLLRQAGEDRS